MTPNLTPSEWRVSDDANAWHDITSSLLAALDFQAALDLITAAAEEVAANPTAWQMAAHELGIWPMPIADETRLALDAARADWKPLGAYVSPLACLACGRLHRDSR